MTQQQSGFNSTWSATALIGADPKTCGGQPVITGTRATLRTVLASLANGDPVDDILKSYPALSRQRGEAVIAFSAAAAHDDLQAPSNPV